MRLKTKKRIELSKIVKDIKERNERVEHLKKTKCELESQVHGAYKEVAGVTEQVEHLKRTNVELKVIETEEECVPVYHELKRDRDNKEMEKQKWQKYITDGMNAI